MTLSRTEPCGIKLRDVEAGAGGGDVVVILADIVAAAAAVAGNERGAALREIAAGVAGLGFDDRAIAVVVEVDEAGGDGEALAIDGFLGGGSYLFTDGDDAAGRDGYVALVGFAAGAIVDGAVLEQDFHLFGEGCVGGRCGRARPMIARSEPKQSDVI